MYEDMNRHLKIFMCVGINHCTKIFKVSAPYTEVMWTAVSWNGMSSCQVGS